MGMLEPELLEKLLSGLSPEEKRVMNYFISNISVGEIVAERELEVFEGIKNPKEVLDALVSKGLLEKGAGCYNLSKKLRESLLR
jgi:uncharacterized membrane protein